MNIFDLISQGLKGERPLLFFGAGQNAGDWIDHLAKNNLSPVAIIDETPQKQGCSIAGIPVVSPEQAFQSWGRDSVILSTIFVPRVAYHHLKTKIESFGFSLIGCVSHLKQFFSEMPFYYFVGSSLDTEIMNMKSKLLQHWVDPVSIKHANSFFDAQSKFDPSLAAAPTEADYFLRDWVQIPDATVYVDAGAYHGDTIEKYFAHQSFIAVKIFAFEPDPNNFIALQRYIDTLPATKRDLIECKQQGVGNINAFIRFQTLGNPSSRASETGGDEVEIIRLDDVLSQNLSYFIKFDVEGAEIDALQGCEAIVSKGKSVIAISVYHRAMDWYEISKYFFEKFPDVQLFFRTLDENGMDSMIYAIPKSWIKVAHSG